jgi:FkbM family methyltransferase
VRHNYATELFARNHSTAAGTVQSYELVARHTDDEMLAAIDGFSDRDAVVYDVGANVGIYSTALAEKTSQRRVLAFEPAPQNVAHLRSTVERNELGDSVDIYPIGLGDTAEQRRFYVSTYPELSGFARESATRWEATVAETVRVQVRPLDDITSGAPPPDVIKIDVEGGAPTVLAGAAETLRTHRPAVFIEPHTTELSDDPTAAIREQLATVGYRIEEHDTYWKCLPES